MTNGQTADKIMQTRNDNSREFWIQLYDEYFGTHSDWNNFWKLVEETM